MLPDLDPNRGIPDALSEAVQWDAKTPEEVCVGRVLRIHRDWLNGGFEQTFSNLEAVEEVAFPYVAAFDDVGLPNAAQVVREALVAWQEQRRSEQELEELDARYERLTYGHGANQTDLIEAALVRYIQERGSAFTSAFLRAASS